MNASDGPAGTALMVAAGGLPLSLLRPGAGATVTTVTGGEQTRRQLGDLGFVPGSEVRVVARRDGDLIVVVRGARVALDRSTARHVLTGDRPTADRL